MIILTAGHTGAHTGAQCAETHFDEGAENIWLRNRIAEILTNKYGLVVLMDDNRASLKLLTKALSEDLSLSDNILHTERPDNTEDIKTCLLGRDFAQQKQDHYVKEKSSYVFLSKSPTSEASPQSVQIRRAILAQQESESLNPEGKKSFQSVLSVGENSNLEGTQSTNSVHSVTSVREKENSVRSDDIIIDLHFNAHTNPNARGTETIVSDDATTLELRFASRLAHTTSDALDIPLRCIKSESQTPHRRLAMLHLTPQSIILEVCFCTSPEDVEAYRNNREKLAADLAWAIYELVTF